MTPESVEEFHARVAAAQSEDGRLPLDQAGMPSWDIFPFAADDLRVKPVEPLADAEPPRVGEEGGPECHCRTDDAGGWPVVWSDERWRLKAAAPSGSPIVLVLEPHEHVDVGDLSADMAAEFGVLTVELVRAVESLPSVARCHVSRWGDGGSHAHVWFYGRPARMPQLRGPYMAVWDDILPPVPVEVRDANVAAVVEHLRAALGR